MTKEEWVEDIKKQYEEAGFEVKLHEGWPLIAKPESFEDTVRLLNIDPKHFATCNIFAEGMLIMPMACGEALSK